MTLTPTQTDRALGAFMGLFTGDALGTTLEFSSRKPLGVDTHRDIVGKGPFRLRAGDWTDDGAMALALARSLLTRGELDDYDAMGNWLRWYRNGDFSSNGKCFDVGVSTKKALLNFESRIVPEQCATPNSAGNGGIMRLAPAALFGIKGGRDEAVSLAFRQARLTHKHRDNYHASKALGGLLFDLVTRPDDEKPLASAMRLKVYDHKHWVKHTRDSVSSRGKARDTLEAALWSTWRTQSFEDALVLAVNLRDDADSVGAVTGQVAGALYGLSSFPRRWVKKVRHWDRLLDVAQQLVA